MMRPGIRVTLCALPSPLQTLTWHLDELPCDTDAFTWFLKLRDRGWPVILESRHCPGQRYDIVAADPVAVIRSTDGYTTVAEAGTSRRSRFDPFLCVEEEMARRRPAEPCPVETGFSGGAIGFFGYELACQLERLPAPAPNHDDIPDMVVGIYDSFVVVDHHLKRTWLIGSPSVDPHRHRAMYKRLLAKPAPPAPTAFSAGEISSNFTQQQYNGAIEKIKSWILEGDCYQVNLAQRFIADCTGDPVALYADLRDRHHAPYSACLAFPECHLLSHSPERFLQVRGDRVVTEPIKGTRVRGSTPAEDERLAAELLASDKDRAENLMIVDLLRNDLGRCCRPGSIEVERLFELRSFPNVHHLVSIISGRLAPGNTAMALLRACFPGGSITGAPKVRAMQIINELEPSRRHAYCGAIGYLGYDGRMDTNLAIRTMVCHAGRVRFWGGGGIVADSTAEAEYQESLDKVNMLRDALIATSRTAGAAQHIR